jgi:hypothetical protein
LGRLHIAAKFMPFLLLEDRKQNHVFVSKELVDRANAVENL